MATKTETVVTKTVKIYELDNFEQLLKGLKVASCILTESHQVDFPTPGLFDEELTALTPQLERILFAARAPLGAGRELYLANAAYMILITHTRQTPLHLPRVTIKCLNHPDYEVQLAALNYLLMLHGHCEEPCRNLEHLSQISNNDVLREIQKDPDYLRTLCVAAQNKYVLVLTPGCPETQRCRVKNKLKTNESLSIKKIATELVDPALNGPEGLRHIYLKSFVELVPLCDYDLDKMAPVLRELRALGAGAAGEESRGAVVSFLERHYVKFLGAEAVALAAILLEDDSPQLRARTAAAVAAAHAESPPSDTKSERGVLAARAARQLRRWAARRPALLGVLGVLAALDFRAARAGADPLHEECRVFDQNETHNVYLEEFTWTSECAKMIKENYSLRYTNNQLDSNIPTIDEYVASLANEMKTTIEELCIKGAFQCLTKRTKSAHPKMDLFWKILHQ